MRGKHGNPIKHLLAVMRRKALRKRLQDLVAWQPLQSPESGCTAIIGVCSRLPDVLAANIRCLAASRWPELKGVIAVFDCVANPELNALQQRIIEAFPELPIRFFYYSAAQSALTEELKLPYVYSWLSWSIAIEHVVTATVLMHDYDALITGDGLEQRYRSFVASKVKVQGISWYSGNGIEPSDQLATTFEAFFDSVWLRSLRPIDLFHNLRAVDGRSLDFDTTLDIQLRALKPEERAIQPMSQDQLVHPSQMVHQYTMFRHSPGKALPVFSIVMIPFFSYVGGNANAILNATREIATAKSGEIDMVGDGTPINLAQLTLPHVDWALKQMVQASLALAMPPNPELRAYGDALYRAAGTQPQEFWRGDFTGPQRAWIEAAAVSLGAASLA